MTNIVPETIIYIGGFELPDRNAAAQRVVANAKVLRDLGYNVVLYGIAREIENNDDSGSLLNIGVNSHSQPYPTTVTNWFKFIIQQKRYVRLLQKYKNVKAVICYNMPAVSLLRLSMYCKKQGMKIFADCTEWYSVPKNGNGFKNLIKRLDIHWRMVHIHPRLDGVICISEFLKSYYSNKDVRVLKIPPLVDLSDTKWTSAGVPPKNKVQLFYAGSPFSIADANVKDRVDLIIQALALLKKKGYDFDFHIIGVSVENLKSLFPILDDDLKILGSSVKVYGRVSHEIAINLLKTADFSIFLRDNTLANTAGFPTKFVESISCGIPVVTNRSSNIADYLVDGENGLWIDASDLNSIADTLAIVLKKNRQEIEFMKAACKASQLFDYRNFVESFKEFLEL